MYRKAPAAAAPPEARGPIGGVEPDADSRVEGAAGDPTRCVAASDNNEANGQTEVLVVLAVGDTCGGWGGAVRGSGACEWSCQVGDWSSICLSCRKDGIEWARAVHNHKHKSCT